MAMPKTYRMSRAGDGSQPRLGCSNAWTGDSRIRIRDPEASGTRFAPPLQGDPPSCENTEAGSGEKARYGTRLKVTAAASQ